MPFGAVQLIATLVSAFGATHWKMKSPILAALCVPPIIGISIMLGVEYTPKNRGVLLFGYYITSVYPAISPLIYSWSGQNTGGDTKRKVTTGVLFVSTKDINPPYYLSRSGPELFADLGFRNIVRWVHRLATSSGESIIRRAGRTVY